MANSLFTFSDGSTLRKIKAKELVNIPVWKGNRFIDLAHANEICLAIGPKIESLDSAIFHVVIYKDGTIEQRYLVDGQHRQHVLKKFYEENVLFAQNFDLLVHEKRVDSEADAIEYFNILNNAKPQKDTDPKLLANKYILALVKQFRGHIKPEGTGANRPNLSSDKVRAVLEKHAALLKQNPTAVAAFVTRVIEWNKKKMAEYELGSAFSTKDQNLIKRALEKKFVLAYDPTFPWIQQCLEQT
jgi:hypothetical protein